MYIYINMNLYAHVYMYIYKCISYIYTYIHVIHIHIHIYIHIYMTGLVLGWGFVDVQNSCPIHITHSTISDPLATLRYIHIHMAVSHQSV